MEELYTQLYAVPMHRTWINKKADAKLYRHATILSLVRSQVILLLRQWFYYWR